MNNKKIIFGILLFCAISFIAYTFANPLEKGDEGTLIQGSDSNNVNNPNSNGTQKDPVDRDEEPGDDDEDLDLPQRVDDETTSGNNQGGSTAVVPSNPNTSRPSGSGSSNSGNSGNNNSGSAGSTPGGGPAPISYYTATLNVVNGYSDKGSITVARGDSAVFKIFANNEYTLNGAKVSGSGCSLIGDTLSVNNMTSNVTCTVTLPAEPIYSTVSIVGDGVTLHQEGSKVTISGKIQSDDAYNTVKLKIRFTAPKIFDDSTLRNASLLINQNGKTYGYDSLASNGNNGASKAYYQIDITFKEGITKSYVIDWGNGRKIQYDLIFNADIEEKPTEIQ